MSTTIARRTGRAPLVLDETATRGLVQRLKLIADRSRLNVLLLLSEGPLNVADLVVRLGQSPAALSHHLTLLRVSGLIRGGRHGRGILYALEDDGWALLELVRAQAGR